MNRFSPCLALLWALLACVPGCNWDLGDLAFDFTSPKLEFVPKRLALGARAPTRIEADGPDADVSTSNPDVVEVVWTESRVVELRAVGPGSTTIRIEEDGQVETYEVEVVEHTRHEVLLVQRGWGLIPAGSIDQRILLAGHPQQVAVALYDEAGLVFGAGLSELTLPERSEECPSQSGGSFDGRCILFDEGVHTMKVDVAGREETILVRAVAEEDIVDVLVVPSTSEELAAPGTRIDVDVVGVTEDGTRVDGLPLEPTSMVFGAFSYVFEPWTDAHVVSFEALGFERELTIHGHVAWRPALEHDCYSSALLWGCLAQ